MEHVKYHDKQHSVSSDIPGFASQVCYWIMSDFAQVFLAFLNLNFFLSHKNEDKNTYKVGMHENEM